MVIPTFIGITILAFALIHLIPGDPIEVMMGERGVDPGEEQKHSFDKITDNELKKLSVEISRHFIDLRQLSLRFHK